MMNHQTAVERHVVERYVLGDLTPAEQAEFEQHFFECEICGRAISDAEAWMEAARVAAVRIPAPPPPWWRRLGDLLNPGWLRQYAQVAAFAAAGLTVVVVYQNALTIPSLRSLNAAQPLETTVLRNVRGTGQEIVLHAGENFFHLMLYPGGAGKTTVECRIRAAAGQPIMEMAVPLTYGSVSLLLPAAQFPDGDYVLTLGPQGPAPAAGGEPTEFRLRIRRSD